jgi:pyruvate/2-oxoglutarate dehydrogenase complex dihydrolipoamide acyltransferase (E2) component
LIYRIETDFASIDVEADDTGIFRHAPGSADALVPGEVIAYLLAPGELLPGEEARAATAAEAPRPRPGTKGRSRVYPLKAVLKAAPAPPEAPSDPAPPLPWESSPVAQSQADADFDAPKPLLLFPRIVSELKEEAAAEDEPPEATEAPDHLEENVDIDDSQEGGWELLPGEADFNPDWLLERNEGVESDPSSDRFQASSIRSLALGLGREPAPPVLSGDPQGEPQPAEDSPEVLPALPLADSPSDLFEARLPVAEAALIPGAASTDPRPLFARATIDVTEALKMRDQLTREWLGSNIRPTEEDIVLRAVARALHESAAFRRRNDVVGVRPLAGSSRSVLVLADAATRPFRDAVASLAALRTTPGSDLRGICTLTNYGAFGLDDAMPALVPGQLLAFAMGSVRLVPVFRGDQPMRASVLALTLTYDSNTLPEGAAARLLSRVCELVEAPYALLAE